MRLNNTHSDDLQLAAGVPQGTKLGPIGFQVIINDAAANTRINLNTGSLLMISHLHMRGFRRGHSRPMPPPFWWIPKDENNKRKKKKEGREKKEEKKVIVVIVFLSILKKRKE